MNKHYYYLPLARKDIPRALYPSHLRQHIITTSGFLLLIAGFSLLTIPSIHLNLKYPMREVISGALALIGTLMLIYILYRQHKNYICIATIIADNKKLKRDKDILYTENNQHVKKSGEFKKKADTLTEKINILNITIENLKLQNNTHQKLEELKSEIGSLQYQIKNHFETHIDSNRQTSIA